MIIMMKSLLQPPSRIPSHLFPMPQPVNNVEGKSYSSPLSTITS